MDAAVEFAQALSDPLRACQLQELALEIRNKMRSQELYNNFLETKLKKDLDRIQNLRQELAAQERRAISAMAEENESNMQLVGVLIGARLDEIFGIGSAENAPNDPNQDDGLDAAGAMLTEDEQGKEPGQGEKKLYPEKDSKHDIQDDEVDYFESLMPDVGPSRQNDISTGILLKLPSSGSMPFRMECDESERGHAEPSSDKVAPFNVQDGGEDFNTSKFPCIKRYKENFPMPMLPVEITS